MTDIIQISNIISSGVFLGHDKILINAVSEHELSVPKVAAGTTLYSHITNIMLIYFIYVILKFLMAHSLITYVKNIILTRLVGDPSLLQDI